MTKAEAQKKIGYFVMNRVDYINNAARAVSGAAMRFLGDSEENAAENFKELQRQCGELAAYVDALNKIFADGQATLDSAE